MTGNDFKSLQIGVFVTDETSLVRTDYCRVEQFDRMGRMKLQPIDSNFNAKGEPYWIHFKDYDLKDKMYKSEIMQHTV